MMKISQKELDQNLVNEMYRIIRLEEANNLKTGKLDDTKMVNKIAQIIHNVLKEADDEI